jgi:hypothetical protein
MEDWMSTDGVGNRGGGGKDAVQLMTWRKRLDMCIFNIPSVQYYRKFDRCYLLLTQACFVSDYALLAVKEIGELRRRLP